MTELMPTLFDQPILPVMPYHGTSGLGGSDASADARRTADTNGTTSVRQRTVLTLLDEARGRGLTWRELGDLTGWHHGTASSALSTLHKVGDIARLTITRERCSVYVALDHVNGREIAAHRPNAATRAMLDIVTEIERLTRLGQTSAVIALCQTVRSDWS